MQTNLMVIINLLFTPITGLSLFLKKKKMEFKFSAKVLELYLLFTTWNIPFTKLFLIVTRKIGLTIVPESGFYTLIALIASIVLYGIFVLGTEVFHISFKVEKKDES